MATGGDSKLGNAYVPIRATLDELDKDLSAAKGHVEKGIKGIAGDLGKGLASGLGIAAGFGVAGLMAGAVSSLSDFVAGAMEAEDIQADLNATLKSTQGAAGMSADAINDLATALTAVTPYEDDAIVKGEAMLLTFTNIGKDVFPQATEAMLNLAQKMGGDLSGAAVQLGKALNDPVKGVTALQRVGVTFSAEQKDLIASLMAVGDAAGAQRVILAELAKEFGGIAQAAGATTQGQLAIFQNTINAVKDSIGTGFLPVIKDLLGQVMAMTGPLTANGAGWQRLGAALAQVVSIPAEAFLSNINAALATTNVLLAPVNALLDVLGVKAKAAGESMSLLDKWWLGFRQNLLSMYAPLATVVKGLEAIWRALDKIRSMKLPAWFAGALNSASGSLEGARKLLGFSAGGTVPGPLGAPTLAVVHGGEEITPPGGSGGRRITINNLYLYGIQDAPGFLAPMEAL
jgi:hypothetical protein